MNTTQMVSTPTSAAVRVESLQSGRVIADLVRKYYSKLKDDSSWPAETYFDDNDLVISFDRDLKGLLPWLTISIRSPKRFCTKLILKIKGEKQLEQIIYGSFFNEKDGDNWEYINDCTTTVLWWGQNTYHVTYEKENEQTYFHFVRFTKDGIEVSKTEIIE